MELVKRALPRALARKRKVAPFGVVLEVTAARIAAARAVPSAALPTLSARGTACENEHGEFGALYLLPCASWPLLTPL